MTRDRVMESIQHRKATGGSIGGRPKTKAKEGLVLRLRDEGAPTGPSGSKQDWRSQRSAGSLLNRRRCRAEDPFRSRYGFLFTNQEARQITADLLRAAGDDWHLPLKTTRWKTASTKSW